MGKMAFYGNECLFTSIDDSLRTSNKDSSVWASVTFTGKPHVIRKATEHEETTYVPFEHIMLPINNGYDTILRNYYGDYMKPVKAPQCHDSILMDESRSYKEYMKTIKFNHWKMFKDSVGIVLRTLKN